MSWLFLILIGVVVIILLLGLFWWGLKKALFLALNSIVGFFALYAVKQWLLHDLVINWVTVLLTAIFGILGFLAVIIIHLFGWAF